MDTSGAAQPVSSKVARAKRTTLRGAITKGVNEVYSAFSLVDPDNRESAEVHLAQLMRCEERIRQYDQIINEDASVIDLQAEVEKEEEYLEKLTVAIDLIRVKLRTVQVSTPIANAPAHATQQQAPSQMLSTVKHPKLEMTEFDGDPLRFEEFWDDFTCSVDSRTDLTAIDKFKLLKNALKGEALSVANGYYLTQKNFEEVKEALKDRFGDPQIAVSAHFMALLELEPASHDVEQLIQVRDKCEAHFRSLGALGLSEDTFGVVFAPIIMTKLPRFVKLQLLRENKSKPWTLKSLREKLKEEIDARSKCDRDYVQSTSASMAAKNGSKADKQGKKDVHSSSALHTQGQDNTKFKGGHGTPKSLKCAFCNGAHWSSECTAYPTVDKRMTRMQGRCLKCLSDRHTKLACRYMKKCYNCGKPGHHHSLCYQRFGRSSGGDEALNPGAPEFQPRTQNESVHTVQSETHTKTDAHVRQGTAVLESALVDVKGENGTIRARVVFDTGSTLSFVRSDLAKKLGAATVRREKTKLSRFGDTGRTELEHPIVRVNLKMRDGSACILNLRRVNSISAPMRLVPLRFDAIKPPFREEEFAELLVEQPCNVEIDILLGLDYYYDIVGPEVWRCDNGLVIKQTAVGKVVTGCMKSSEEYSSSMLVLRVDADNMPDLERLWRFDEIGIADRAEESDDETAVQKFHETVRYNGCRYEVQWPFKEDPPELPQNLTVAEKRLASVCRRLQSDPQLLEKYDDIFNDQLAKGVIEVAPEVPEGPVHYLPHHAVVTPAKETTKVRVVFDASSKANARCVSLNESMHRGPVFLNDLCGLLLRFRLPAFAVSSDVEKAFLQIALQTHHRDCTRFLWLRDIRKPPNAVNRIVYRYARVLFGAKASPFLLAATIIYHMVTTGTEVALRIKDGTYIDNVFSGEDDTDGLLRYYEAAKSLFASMSMNLREWYSNDSQFMAAIHEKDRGKSQTPSVLGLKWNIADDTIRLRVGNMETQKVTKRTILKGLASVYDPCGWLTAVTISGRALMQTLWKAKIAWDVEVPPEAQKIWTKLSESLEQIKSHVMPRRVSWPIPKTPDNEFEFELHVFGDASAIAYAACVYLRAKRNEEIRCDLLFAKSRVAPVKVLTIPRLELLAALIGSKLIVFVENHLKLPIAKKVLWTDSMCVLSWIRSPKVLTVFVENRVRQIRSVPGLEKRYVPTECNPADIGSRGASYEQLKESSMWWAGPAWLSLNSDAWPSLPATLKPELTDDHAIVVQAEQDPEEDPVFKLKIPTMNPAKKKMVLKFSSLNRLLRVTAQVFRACVRFRSETITAGKYITAEEMKTARRFWERRVQDLHYRPLLDKKPSKKWRNLKLQLGTFKASDGLVRCKGRFQFSEALAEETKFPILLPKGHGFTDLIIRSCHEQVVHLGVKHTLAKVREKYWVCQGMSAVKSVLLDCQVCRVQRCNRFASPDEAPLPSFRIAVKRPFACTGLDYLGPVYVRVGKDKEKAWIVLFTCAVMRAIHLEVVESLSASDFLLSLRRFVALCGRPDRIISDNASQLKMSDQLLKKEFRRLSQEPEVISDLAKQGIEWKFIVEKAPWMGGFYERLVATVKQALKASLGSWTVTPVEMQTLTYEIAFAINSRPLTYLDDDPGNKALTPLDLLFRSTECFPDMSGEQMYKDKITKADELVMHWRAGQNLLRQFWDSWQSNYLLSLRSTWRQQQDRDVSDIAPAVGVVVLIKDNLPRGMWRMGRILKLRKSQDGHVRSAEVRLPNGSTLVRPLKLLYPIEGSATLDETNTDSDDEDNVSDHDKAKPDPPNGGRPRRKAAVQARQKIQKAVDN